MPTKYETMVEAQDGYDIVTTIDYRIQSSLEHYLKDSFYDSVAQGRVCGIVMDVNTGAVLCREPTLPADLNNPYELDDWSKEQLAQYTPETEEYAEQESQLRPTAVEQQVCLLFIRTRFHIQDCHRSNGL